MCGLANSFLKTRDFIHPLFHRSSKITVFVHFTVSLPCLMESVCSEGGMLGAERRETTKRRRQSHFCLSFMGALSLSCTNGTGSFLLSVTSSNKDCRKELYRDCINCYLLHKKLCKTRWCGHRCFKRI